MDIYDILRDDAVYASARNPFVALVGPPRYLGYNIEVTPLAYTVGGPDTSTSRSPGRALRRHRNGKHVLPSKITPTCYVMSDTIFVHPDLYKRMRTQLDITERTMVDDAIHRQRQSLDRIAIGSPLLNDTKLTVKDIEASVRNMRLDFIK